MERDFLGLNNMQYLSNVKREVNDDVAGELSLSNKAAKQWGKTKPFANSSFLPSSPPQEAKAFPWGSVSAASVFRRSQYGGAFQNAQPLLLGGAVPVTTHSSLVPRVASSGSTPQLTIFYNGTISVFNDITPEKAQAVMLCAGNGVKGETGESSLKRQTVKEAERTTYGKQIQNTAAAAASSSSESFSMCRDRPIAATNTMSLIESFNAAPGRMIPSVPQARKASLARFLEKRKERLMSALPYKKMLLDSSSSSSSVFETS